MFHTAGSLARCGEVIRVHKSFDAPYCIAQQKHPPAGCSKRPDFSPAQPWQLFHPPALSLPRQPLRPGMRLIPCKAAASYHFIRGGWNDPNCAHYSTRPAPSAPRRALSRARAYQFSLPLFRGVAKAALNCAHRTSTVSPCAFCEQGGHLAAPSSSFSSRALREHGDRPSHPAPFSASC